MFKPLLLIAVLLIALAAAPVWADVSRDEAAATAQRATGGRVLSVEKGERDGRPVWRVKVVTSQGEVRIIYVDVASGRVLQG